MKMLENNRKTWLALQDKVETTDIPINQRVDQVLESIGQTESRAAKMDLNDILKLLLAFHEAGIHFA